LVLVAEDDAPIRGALSCWLEDEGYRVHCAADGQEALEMVASVTPDLVLSDVQMPNVDGPELVRRLRDRGQDIPVVLISAWYDGIDQPGVRFVAKPFDFLDIARAIERSLSDDRQGGARRGWGSGAPGESEPPCGDPGPLAERLGYETAGTSAPYSVAGLGL
jgi:CheY-like chemotaxis protein